MPSVIHGFEYDIFISYRQKDNRYDGWVTQFVNNLNKELEATFKEDISIYFDENPHDGLLETHNVDKSLERKLKCLIFIPILSQTYCDPKSFAWNHEFCPFNKMAATDQFGRDIVLRNGNVGSRILPVKIHDLDPEDIGLLENELGGVLRAIEFIYTEAGVNRPLRSNEENPARNLNQTNYRNQVNKVANAIKEIVLSLRAPAGKLRASPFKTRRQQYDVRNSRTKRSISRIAIGVLVLFTLLFSIYTFTDVIDIGKPAYQKSIAVLPLTNLSGDPEQDYLAEGLHDALIGELGSISNFRVISKTSTLRYENSKMLIQDIATELGVDLIVEGSVSMRDNILHINARMINPFPTENQLWSNEYQGDLSNVFVIQGDVVRSIAKEINVSLTPHEKKLLANVPTVNPAAYKAFLKGEFHWNKLTRSDLDIALEYYEQAKTIDPNFALAYIGIASVWGGRVQQGLVSYVEAEPKMKEAKMKALQFGNGLAETHLLSQLISSEALWLCWQEWNFTASEKELRRAIAGNSNNSKARAYFSHVLLYLDKPEEAREQIEYAIALDPFNPLYQGLFGMYLNFVKQYDKAIEVLTNALKTAPTDALLLSTLRSTYHNKGMYSAALESWKRSYLAKGDHKAVESLIQGEKNGGYEGALVNLANTLIARSDTTYVTPWQIATLFARAGKMDESIPWLEKAYYVHDNNMPYIKVDPIFDFMRSDPRFQQLMEKMGYKTISSPVAEMNSPGKYGHVSY